MKPGKKNKHALARIEPLILTVRGQRVILDSNLAKVYGVTTSRLNEQLRRNIDRFPEDFAFQLTMDEFANLISQNATSSGSHGGRRKPPTVFTEHGAIMPACSTSLSTRQSRRPAGRAANVLKTRRAVQMSVFVVRAFVRLRETLLAHKDLTEKLRELERKVGEHDEHIRAVIAAIRELMTPPEPPPKRRIGFGVEEPKVKYRIGRRR